MRVTKYIFAAAATLMLCGCFEDKGNYDYIDLKQPEDRMDWTYYAEIGKRLEIKPDLGFPEPKTADDYLFEWYVLDEKIGEGYPLVIENYQGRISNWKSKLVVTEKNTGIRYFYEFMLNTSAPMQSGWLIIGEKGGKTKLDFVPVVIKDEKPEYKLLENIIPDLPANPKKMVEHWGAKNDLGQVAILCADNKAAEYDGKNFAKVIDVEREFIDTHYPAGFSLDDIHYMKFNSLAYSVNGDMHARYNNIQDAFQTGSYMQVPLYPENGMKVGFTVWSRYLMSGQGLIYDTQNNRFLVALDENDKSAGRVLPILTYHKDQKMEKIFPLNDIGAGNKVLACCSFPHSSYWSCFYIALIRGNDGKTYTQEFSVDVYPRTSASAAKSIVERREITNGHLLGADTKMLVCYDEYDKSFYATGDKIYYMTRTGTTLRPFADFKGVNVASFTYDVTKYPTLANRQLGIGLADGSFKVYDITVPGINNALDDNPTVLFDCKTMDKIVNVIHKQGLRSVTGL